MQDKCIHGGHDRLERNKGIFETITAHVVYPRMIGIMEEEIIIRVLTIHQPNGKGV